MIEISTMMMMMKQAPGREGRQETDTEGGGEKAPTPRQRKTSSQSPPCWEPGSSGVEWSEGDGLTPDEIAAVQGGGSREHS
mmetsp:Transcript_45664/g.98610  ORF Transcript_45664/g.98610 Transcript_45664/m.98610 type:complete len:81 (+) Transcript_45664:154-396(+)